MSCKITKVKDEDLKDSIKSLGAKEGILSYITHVSLAKELGINRKEVSGQQKINIQKRVKDYNSKNGRSFFVNFTRRGQSDLYTWDITDKGDGQTKLALDISEQEEDNIKEDPKFSFVNESISRIESGEKSITLRTKDLKSGIYPAGKSQIRVDQRGLFSLDEYLDLTGQTKTEFRHEFIQDDQIKEDHIRDFFDGKTKLWIYKVSPVTSYDLAEKDHRYENEANRLQELTSKFERLIKSTSDQDLKQYYRDRLKQTKVFIDYLKKEENQKLINLLTVIEAELDQAENLIDKGNTHLGLTYIYSLDDIIPEDLDSKELTVRKDLIKKRIEDLRSKALKLDTLKLAKSTNATDLIDINGNATPFIQDKAFISTLYDASVSSNQWVREGYRRITSAINKYVNKVTFTKKEIKELKDKVIKYQKSLGLSKDKFWNFMLQTDESGQRTGYSISKFNYKYNKDKKENYYNYGDKNPKQLRKYADWIKDNHNIQINEEVLRQYQDSKTKWIMDQDIILDESKYRTEEEKEDAINNIKLGRVAAMKYNTDANRFKEIINKQIRTSKELDFLDSYLNPNIWKSFNGQRIIDFEVINPEYKEEKYKQLMSLDDNNPLKQWFIFYNNTIKATRMEANDWEQDNNLSLNYIPELQLEANLLKKLPDFLKETFTELPEHRSGILKDPVTLEPQMIIHDANMLTGKVNPKFKNYNLDKVLEKYLDGHYSKKYKSEVEDDANSILNIIKNQKEYEVDSKGDIVKDNTGTPRVKESQNNEAYKVFKYHIESIIYDRRQDKQGQLNTVYYDSVTQAEIDDPDTSEERKQELLNNAKVVTTKKGINALINFTAIKALAFNIFSGGAEMLQSTLSLYIESAGSKFFTSKEVLSGFGQSIKLLNPLNHKEADKWFNNFPILNGFGYDVDKSIWSKTFIGFESAEKLTKGALIFAYLEHRKVEDKNKTEYSLKDALKFNEKGEAYLDDSFEDNFGIDSKLRHEVINDLASISKKLLSRDNQRDPIQLNKHFVGRLLGQFRSSWMFEGFLRRWGQENPDAILGDQKGYYRSVFWNNGEVDIKRAMNILWTAIKSPEELSIKFGLKELDINNIKKSVRELQVVTSLLAMYLSLGMLRGDDDDEESFAQSASNFLINMSYRANRDLTFYINPKATTEIFDSPLVAMGTVKQMLQFTQAVIESPFDPYVFEDTKKEQLKVIHSGSKLIPVLGGLKSTINKVTNLD